MLLSFFLEQRLTNNDIVQTLSKNQKLSSKVQLKICQSLDSIASAMKTTRRRKSSRKNTRSQNEVQESESESDSLSD